MELCWEVFLCLFSSACCSFCVAADGFAASVCLGLSPGQSAARRLLAAAAVTGLHALLFALGHALGRWGALWLGPLCRWLPGLLLLALGCLSFRPGQGGGAETGPGPGRVLALAVSSSLDAATVGLSFALRAEPLLPTLRLLAAVMGALSLAGVSLGKYLGRRSRGWAERVGGGILCLLGLKNLLGG